MSCCVVTRSGSSFYSRASRRLPLHTSAALLLFSPCALHALDATLTRIGLFGDAFPSTMPESSVTELTDVRGPVAGYSERPEFQNETRIYFETAAWITEGTTTTRVGLYDGPDFSLSPGTVGELNPFSRHSRVTGFGSGEGAFGYSSRFSAELYTGESPGRFYSRRYARGESAWIYFGGVTTEVGLATGEHVALDGARSSTVTALNAAGQAIGTSRRYTNFGGLVETSGSASTWFFNGTSTVRTGLVDGDHTAGDNFHRSDNFALNESGDVVGTTNRYGSTLSVSLGRSAWLHHEGQTIDISLTGRGLSKTVLDNGAERSFRVSNIVALKNDGQVLGTAQLFNGDADAGQAAWHFSPAIGETRDISPLGEGFVRDDGYRFATSIAFTDLGHGVGHATRYSGASENGRAVWRFDGEQTLDIGLDTPEVVGPGGARTDTFVNTMPGGKVLGYSARTDGGREAWLHDPNRPGRDADTQAIGLSGAGRTQTIVAHTSGGQVVGHADRPDGGREAWRYDGSITTDIGMGGPGFETAAGLRHSTAQFTNSRGDVAGVAQAYDETGVQYGTAFWFNDGVSTRQVTPAFATAPNIIDGRYYPTVLTESGLFIGHREINLGSSSSYKNVFIWDSQATPGAEMTHIDAGRFRNAVDNDIRFISDQHGMVIGEYRDSRTLDGLFGYYVWVRGKGTFDLESLVGIDQLQTVGLSTLFHPASERGLGYTFTETEEGVFMSFLFKTASDNTTYTYRLFIDPAAIPEPASFGVLAGAGALGLSVLRRRRRAVR